MDLIHLTEYQLYTTKIEKLKMALLGDLHYTYRTSYFDLKKIINVLETINPNYAVFVGDTLDTTEVIEDSTKRKLLLDFIHEIGNISTIIFGLGSHDFARQNSMGKWEEYHNASFFTEIRETPNTFLLDNESYQDKNIYIAGVTQPYEYFNPVNYEREDRNLLKELLNQQRALLSQMNKDKLNFFLTHSPLYLQEQEIMDMLKEFDYFLSGHTHNGLVPGTI